ncbi:MAG TPA: hypothetical protein EYQ15_00530 [Candidatus Poseidoniales archaeon]|nr:hypothetical protein [Candidatus Poseidoniales archaeon]
MPSKQRPSALALVTLLLAMSMSPYAVSGQVNPTEDVTCCNSTDFNLYLMGESGDGTLTPFDENLESAESDSQSTLATPSFSETNIGTWGVVWGTEGDYQNSTWEFSIPYEVESAVGVTINSTLEIRIGGSFYDGDGGVDPYLTGSGMLQISVEIGSGHVNDGDLLELSLTVRSLLFAQPGDDAGIRFLWGSEANDAHISVRFPLVDIEMKDASVLGRLVYFPIVLKSGFDDRMWTGSTGGISVQSAEVSQMPIATGVEGGVEVTFVWEVPENSEGGNIRVDFQLKPQSGLQIDTTRTHDIVIGEDTGGTGWYPANEPLRTGGSSLDLEIEAKWDGYVVDREVMIKFDGSMSQWMRWGLDNIGNQSLSSNSWWRNLNSYADSVPSADKHNGRVDDSELLALQGHLTGSATNLRSFMANGLSLEIEAILGVNPIELGPTEITIDMGGTRAFSADAVTIFIDTSYSYDSMEAERQVLVETFVRSSTDDYWTGIELTAELRSTLLEDLGAVAADDIEYKHRRWIILEVLTVDEPELDPELDFRVEFQPSGFALYSVLYGAMMSVLFLSVGIGFAMSLTKRRSSVPAVVTVVALGCLALVIYVLGMPMPIVFGVSISSILLVFPVALVSPKTETIQRIGRRSSGPHIDCPVCSTRVLVESDVRPLRVECPSCKSMLRVEE